MNDGHIPGFASAPFDHLTFETALLLDAPIEIRLAHIDLDTFIINRISEEILKFMQRLLSLPRGPRRRCLAILGEPGSGKTWLIREFLRRNGIDRYSMVGPDGRRTILRLSLAAVADEEEFVMRLMRALGSPTSSKRKWKEFKETAIELLLKSDTLILIMDECQDLGKTRSRDLPSITYYLRHLCNEGERPMVLLGSADAQLLIEGCEHLRSRFEIVTLQKWSSLEDTRGFVFALLSLIPLPEPSPVTDEDTLRKFLESTRGNTERMALAIKEAGRTAICDGARHITRDRLLAACGGVLAFATGAPGTPKSGKGQGPAEA